MIDGPIAKQLVIFALPLMLANLLQQLLNTTDALIVGRLISMEALTGVTQASRVIMVLNSLFLGIGVGAGVVISHFYGAKDKENYSKAMHTTVLAGLLLGLLVTGIGLVLTRPILGLMGLSPDSILYQYAVDYLLIYFVGVVFVFVFNMGAGILRAVGDSVSPLIFLFVAVFLNIGLTFLFLRSFNMGVIGVAVSTIISQAVATILVLLKLFLTKNDYRMSIKKLRIDKKIFVKIIRVGIPVGLHTSIISSAHIFMQRYINGFDNFDCNCSYPYYPNILEHTLYCLTRHTPHANGVATLSKIDGFVYMPMMALSLALTTFVGQNVGADREDRAKKAMKVTLIISMIITVIMSIVVFIVAEPLMRLVAPDIGYFYIYPNSEAIEIGLRFMRVLVFSYPILMLNDIMGGSLRGAGKALVPSIILVCCMFGIRLLFLFFAIDLGGMDILAVFLTFPIAWSISSICMTVYFFKSGLKKKERINIGNEERLREQLAQKALREVSMSPFPKQIGVERLVAKPSPVTNNEDILDVSDSGHCGAGFSDSDKSIQNDDECDGIPPPYSH